MYDGVFTGALLAPGISLFALIYPPLEGAYCCVAVEMRMLTTAAARADDRRSCACSSLRLFLRRRTSAKPRTWYVLYNRTYVPYIGVLALALKKKGNSMYYT